MAEEQKYNMIDMDDKNRDGEASAVLWKETKEDDDACILQETGNNQQ